MFGNCIEMVFIHFYVIFFRLTEFYLNIIKIRSSNTSGCLLKIDCSEGRKIITSPLLLQDSSHSSGTLRPDGTHRADGLSSPTGQHVCRQHFAARLRWPGTSWPVKFPAQIMSTQIAHIMRQREPLNFPAAACARRQLLYCIFYGNKVWCNTVSVLSS